jgi:hypothetical protein
MKEKGKEEIKEKRVREAPMSLLTLFAAWKRV